MQSFHDVVVAIVAFIILIGVMVVVHELGHFIAAKLCGVRVEAFSVGFGPRLFGIKYGETDYKVCLLPLGGYVKMTGETPDALQEGDNAEAAAQRPSDDPGSFLNHPRWQRMIIGVAGPIANFILAFVLMLVYYQFINEVPKYVVKSTTVEWVVPGSDAAKAGFQPGDVIKGFDGVENPDWMQVGNRAQMNLNQNVSVTVERDGHDVPLTLHIPGLKKGDDEVGFTDAGILPQFTPNPIGVHAVQGGTPAARAGLQAGDKIESVDGHPFHSVTTLLAYMQANPGKELAIGILRNGQHLTLHATPTKMISGRGQGQSGISDWKLGFEAEPSPLRNDPLSFGKAAAQANSFCIDNSSLILEVLGRLFERKVAVSQLSGPVGIARMAGEAAQMTGWLPKFGLAAAISINLGILNLMPFPILDGGLILLLIIESILRHDISVVVKERIYQAAFVVLVAFFAFIIFSDVTKLPIFNHVRP